MAPGRQAVGLEPGRRHGRQLAAGRGAEQADVGRRIGFQQFGVDGGDILAGGGEAVLRRLPVVHRDDADAAQARDRHRLQLGAGRPALVERPGVQGDQHAILVALRHALRRPIVVDVDAADPGVFDRGRKQGPHAHDIGIEEHRIAVDPPLQLRRLVLPQMLDHPGPAFGAQIGRDGNRHGGHVHRSIRVDLKLGQQVYARQGGVGHGGILNITMYGTITVYVRRTPMVNLAPTA